MEEVYIKYNKEVYLYAFSLCKNHHLAQDLTSDTFFKAYLTIGENDYLKYWLFRVCKNLYLDYLKKDKKFIETDNIHKTLSTEETPLDKIIEKQSTKELYDLIINLNENYKELLILYYFCDFSIKEISDLKNITESLVKTNLFRARKKLKRDMEEQVDGL